MPKFYASSIFGVFLLYFSPYLIFKLNYPVRFLKIPIITEICGDFGGDGPGLIFCLTQTRGL